MDSASVAARLLWWRELLLTAAVYVAYSAARDFHGHAISPVDYTRAFRNARSVMSVERTLHIGIEHGLQQLALHATWVTQIANVFYGSAHFIVTVCVLVWLYRRHPERYRRWRWVLLVGTAVAVVGFVIFPVAPPRMLPASYGFTDTLRSMGGLWSFNSGVVEHISDPFAAMPSLHMCWAVWCVAASYPFVRRWLVVAYPAVTALVVLATGNHYVLDIVAGVACVGVGVVAIRPRRLRGDVLVELRRRLGDGRGRVAVGTSDGSRRTAA